MAIRLEDRQLPRRYSLFLKKRLNLHSLTRSRIRLIMQPFQRITALGNKSLVMVESFLISTTPVMMSPLKNKKGKALLKSGKTSKLRPMSVQNHQTSQNCLLTADQVFGSPSAVKKKFIRKVLTTSLLSKIKNLMNLKSST